MLVERGALELEQLVELAALVVERVPQVELLVATAQLVTQLLEKIVGAEHPHTVHLHALAEQPLEGLTHVVGVR
jgi:hypothetical protein